VHIPDGYLSPETCTAFGAAMVPFWVTAARRVRKIVKSRYVPLLAIGAAYCFLVIMFNVPIPDGTTAHAVGGVLVAVLLGPWAAIIAVSTALGIQALFFGDGGVLAFGANCFNMALVMPTVGYGMYLLLTRRSSLTSSRRPLAAGIGAYVGLNVAALCAAIELGIQPTLFHSANGTPLYAPFHLAQTIPAMALAHLTVAGAVEFALTAGVLAYLQRANLPLLRINHAAVPDLDAEVRTPRRVRWRWAVIGLGVMTVLTPLGLLAPGSAFGENGPNRFHAALKGYDFTHDKHPTIGYLVSAGIGLLAIAVVVFGVYALARAIRRARARDGDVVRDDQGKAIA
jgi:cobalt/nickel transport system permease protein